MNLQQAASTSILLGMLAGCQIAQAEWFGYGRDPQHTGISPVQGQDMQTILWETPVDLFAPGSFAHYGSPLATAANTIVIPVRNASGGWQVEGRQGSDGSLLWTQVSDYVMPSNTWLPPYTVTLAPVAGAPRLYYQGAGGTVYHRGALDAPGNVVPTQIAFFGSLASYQADKADYDSNVIINTPLTADNAGNVYFGYRVSNPAAVGGLQSGIARIASDGTAVYNPLGQPQIQIAPALSNDGSTVYFAMASGNLTAFNSSTLAQENTVAVAGLHSLSTASPTVGPNGDVYFGTLSPNFGFSRGNLHHFSADLQTTKIPGSFGWDTTVSIVPASMVPGYTSAAGSQYLLFTKYNSYGFGGAPNKIAILDPNVMQADDPLTAQTNNMLEVMTQISPNGAEWCINSGVVDPLGFSVYANNEDGTMYRWDLSTYNGTTNLTGTLYPGPVLFPGGHAQPYTPTVIGPDGTLYGITNGQLFAVGVPEPSTFALAMLGLISLGAIRRRFRPRAGADAR